MKRLSIILIFFQVYLIQYGQIIADHTIIDKFDDIPQYYIDEVKKMMIWFPGESHSAAYRTGMELLEAIYPAYACNVNTGEAYTDEYVRVENSGWIGEATWFTWYAYPISSRPSASTTIKNRIASYNIAGHPFNAVGFAWCSDMVFGEGNESEGYDPVYGSRWYGASIGGPDGDMGWGLDGTDYTITGNRVDLTTYFSATEEYISYCNTNGYPTKIVYTTGPVDLDGNWIGEGAYQGHIKHEAIRTYVQADPTKILFDYADILSYDDNGSLTTQTWDGHTFPSITTVNAFPKVSAYHISEAGAIRLAKAQWWLLARIAGWDGGTTAIPVTGITVTGAGGSSVITTDNGTLQLSAAIAPTNATNQTVTWSIANGTGQATISTTGLVTAVSNGTVTARATANDGSGIYGTLVITISSQVIPVTGITVTGAGGSSIITTDNGTLQLSAAVAPTNATNQTVTWSMANGTGQATISSTGLVTAVSNGTVTARATANDGSGIYGTLVITISSQVIPVTGITVTGAGGSSAITTDNGTLQLSAAIAPTTATNQTVTWSIANGTGQATISTTGLVTAVSNGTVTARATANDGSGIFGTLVITISSQVIPVTGITVTGAGGSSAITTDNGTLQLSAAIVPTNATNQTVTWTIANGTGQATISSTGLVTAVSNGTVTARATANDGSGIFGTLVITISSQVIPVTGITVTGAGGSSVITTDNGTLQLSAAVAPTNATNQTVTWTIANGTGQATISSTGLVTAVSNGTVTARATANDGSGIFGTLVITISSQVIPVTGITVTGAGGSSVITTDNGILQLGAAITPTNATNQTVTWTIANGTGQATISSTGLVTAVSNGTVTARATANDGSGIFGTLVITISSQVIPVTGITVTGAGGSSVITTDNGILQLGAAITPTNATNQTVTWTIANGTGQATISSTGLVTAVSNGTVTARATANDGSGVYGTLVITISSQVIPVTGITVTGAGGSSIITTDNGTLQLSAAVTPTNATNQTVTWTIANGTGQATISSTGLVTAVSNGTVTARVTANDGSGIFGTLVITISSQVIPVTGITVTGAGGSSVITTDNGTLQLTAAVTPTNATNQTVTWTIANGTGQATISSTGLVTAVSNGTVTARATANDGSGIYGTLVITISSQVIPVTGITVTGAGGSSVITTDNGTLQLSAAVAPTNATNQTVTWTIANGTGQATISSTGLVAAVSNGTVTARATANDGSGIYGTLIITISSQVIPVTGITVTGAGGSSVITTDNGTLQMSAAIAPSTATNKTVTWTIANGTGQATISSTGLVTAVSNGTVTARATANDGSGIYGTLVITISSQVIPVTGITVTGAGGSSVITTDNGTLQLSAAVAPTNATNQTVTWTIANGTGQATISSTGLVAAVSNGTVTARATANDGSGIYGTLIITISSQVIPVTGITVTGAGGSSVITTDNGTLQMSAAIAPSTATNKTVTWTIANGTGQATISSTGLVTAVSNGTVTARATANDGSGIYGTLVITISSQVIPVTGITVTGAGGSSVITTDNGTLQLSAAIAPTTATNKTVTWSIANGTGQATISSTGLVAAVSNGTVTARATANDGSGIFGTLVITISSQVIPVTGITVTGAGGSSIITTDNGTLQLTAAVTPTNATNQTVTWTIANGTGQATISSTGLVTAVSNGTVTARATANDGSGIFGTLVITISSQATLVTRINVASAKGESIITTANGTLQLSASVAPTTASNQTVTWSIINGTGQASIDSRGLVTAIANGIVTARATANDGSGIFGELSITITNQFVAVAGITVTGEGGATTIDTNDGTLQMIATILPSNATDKSVTWSLVDGKGHADISPTGLVTAKSNGKVTVRASANDGSGYFGDIEIALSNQTVQISEIKIKSSKNSGVIIAVNKSLQLQAEVLPVDATDQTVAWSVINGTGQATISEAGLVTGISEGEVTIVATSNDGSGVFGELAIMIKLVDKIKIRYNRNELTILVPDELIPSKASLHSLHGSKIETRMIDSNECIFDISRLPAGMYVVSVYNSTIRAAEKIVIPY